jgi:predicted DCC family thiol-disulfide oxidoreductase YuxK
VAKRRDCPGCRAGEECSMRLPYPDSIAAAHEEDPVMPEWRFKLLYDGECPFCRREVEWLRRWDRHANLALEDIAAPDFDPAQYGLTQEEVMGVLHGVLPDGRVVRRLEAMRQAYRAVGLGWLVAPTRLPVVRWVLDRLYGLFARHRVRLGKLFGRKCESGTCGVSTRTGPESTRWLKTH